MINFAFNQNQKTLARTIFENRSFFSAQEKTTFIRLEWICWPRRKFSPQTVLPERSQTLPRW
jgi:hypothetical protein